MLDSLKLSAFLNFCHFDFNEQRKSMEIIDYVNWCATQDTNEECYCYYYWYYY